MAYFRISQCRYLIYKASIMISSILKLPKLIKFFCCNLNKHQTHVTFYSTFYRYVYQCMNQKLLSYFHLFRWHVRNKRTVPCSGPQCGLYLSGGSMNRMSMLSASCRLAAACSDQREPTSNKLLH